MLCDDCYRNQAPGWGYFLARFIPGVLLIPSLLPVLRELFLRVCGDKYYQRQNKKSLFCLSISEENCGIGSLRWNVLGHLIYICYKITTPYANNISVVSRDAFTVRLLNAQISWQPNANLLGNCIPCRSASQRHRSTKCPPARKKQHFWFSWKQHFDSHKNLPWSQKYWKTALPVFCRNQICFWYFEGLWKSSGWGQEAVGSLLALKRSSKTSKTAPPPKK